MSAAPTETWAIASAIAGIVSAIGGAFAAYAAFRSARSADDSTKRSEELERRGLFRDVMAAANNIVAETLRIDDLGNRLKREYQSLAAFSGNTGGSRVKLYIEEVERKQTEIGPIQQQARAALEDMERLRNAPEQVLVEQLTSFEGRLIQVRRMKDKIAYELAAIEKDNLIYREKAIRGPDGL